MNVIMDVMDYMEIERSLEQAQKELGDAISSLRDAPSSAPFHALANSASASKRSSVETAQHSQISAKNDTEILLSETKNMETIDFLSIFAQNNLLEDSPATSSSSSCSSSFFSSSSAFSSCSSLTTNSVALNSSSQSHTATPCPRVSTASKARPADRPLTLSRPVHVPSCCNFKRQPWRLYVHGEFSYDSLPKNFRGADAEMNSVAWKNDLVQIIDELDAATRMSSAQRQDANTSSLHREQSNCLRGDNRALNTALNGNKANCNFDCKDDDVKLAIHVLQNIQNPLETSNKDVNENDKNCSRTGTRSTEEDRCRQKEMPSNCGETVLQGWPKNVLSLDNIDDNRRTALISGPEIREIFQTPPPPASTPPPNCSPVSTPFVFLPTRARRSSVESNSTGGVLQRSESPAKRLRSCRARNRSLQRRININEDCDDDPSLRRGIRSRTLSPSITERLDYRVSRSTQTPEDHVSLTSGINGCLVESDSIKTHRAERLPRVGEFRRQQMGDICLYDGGIVDIVSPSPPQDRRRGLRVTPRVAASLVSTAGISGSSVVGALVDERRHLVNSQTTQTSTNDNCSSSLLLSATATVVVKMLNGVTKHQQNCGSRFQKDGAELLNGSKREAMQQQNQRSKQQHQEEQGQEQQQQQQQHHQLQAQQQEQSTQPRRKEQQTQQQQQSQPRAAPLKRALVSLPAIVEYDNTTKMSTNNSKQRTETKYRDVRMRRESLRDLQPIVTLDGGTSSDLSDATVGLIESDIKDDANSESCPSLLDSLHKKFYPDQYSVKPRDYRTRSTETLSQRSTVIPTSTTDCRDAKSATLPHGRSLSASADAKTANLNVRVSNVHDNKQSTDVDSNVITINNSDVDMTVNKNSNFNCSLSHLEVDIKQVLTSLPQSKRSPTNSKLSTNPTAENSLATVSNTKMNSAPPPPPSRVKTARSIFSPAGIKLRVARSLSNPGKMESDRPTQNSSRQNESSIPQSSCATDRNLSKVENTTKKMDDPAWEVEKRRCSLKGDVTFCKNNVSQPAMMLLGDMPSVGCAFSEGKRQAEKDDLHQQPVDLLQQHKSKDPLRQRQEQMHQSNQQQAQRLEQHKQQLRGLTVKLVTVSNNVTAETLQDLATPDNQTLSPSSSGCSEVSPSSLNSTNLSPESSVGVTSSTSGISPDMSVISSPLGTVSDHGIYKEDKAREITKRSAGLQQFEDARLCHHLEDDRYPLSLDSVTTDHEFLDKDCLSALKRRLSELNKFAEMNIHIPRNKLGIAFLFDDYNRGGETIALSNKWSFDLLSGQWLSTSPELSHTRSRNIPFDRSRSVTNNNNEKQHSNLRRLNTVSDCVAADQIEMNYANRSSTISRSSPISKDVISCDTDGLKCNGRLENRLLGNRCSLPPPSSHVNGVTDIPLHKTRNCSAGPVDEVAVYNNIIGNSGLVNGSRLQNTNSLSPLVYNSTVNNAKTVCRMRHSIQVCSNAGSTTTDRNDRGHDVIVVEGGRDVVQDGAIRTNGVSDTLPDAHSGSAFVTVGVVDSAMSSVESEGRLNVINRERKEDEGWESERIETEGAQVMNGAHASFGVRRDGKERVCDDKEREEEDEGKPRRTRRSSFYDNLSASELSALTPDIQRELDLILSELYYNIDNLDDNLTSLQEPPLSVTDYVPESNERAIPSTTSRASGETTSDQKTSMSDIQSSKSASVGSQLSNLADVNTVTSPATVRNLSDILRGKSSPSSSGLSRDSRQSATMQRVVSSDDNDNVARTAQCEPVCAESFVRDRGGDASEANNWWEECFAPDNGGQEIHLNHLYAKQLTALKKLNALKLTALFDRYSPSFDVVSLALMRLSSANHSSENPPDTLGDQSKKVFGVSLATLLKRDGCPVPSAVLMAIDHLRLASKDAVGIFRKSGTVSQIQKLQDQMNRGELNLVDEDIYDIADVLKRYFRELPECLLTENLSPLFVTIFIQLPEELRVDALRKAIALLPDANRHLLETILTFLHEISQHSAINQMTPGNLAVCFLMSFFRPSDLPSTPIPGVSRSESITSQLKPLEGGAGGGVAAKTTSDVWDYRAALACVTSLISNAFDIFTLSPVSYAAVMTSSCTGHSTDSLLSSQDAITSSEIKSHLHFCLDITIKDHGDWRPLDSNDQYVNLSVKDILDNECLSLWRCVVDIDASPVDILARIRCERHLWMRGLQRWHVIDRVHDNADVFLSVFNVRSARSGETGKMELREFCEFRCWKSDLHRGACALVSTSTEHPSVHAACSVRAAVLANHFLIEPVNPTMSRVSHVSRIDIRGHSQDWYKAAYGRLLVDDISELRRSFQTKSETFSTILHVH